MSSSRTTSPVVVLVEDSGKSRLLPGGSSRSIVPTAGRGDPGRPTCQANSTVPNLGTAEGGFGVVPSARPQRNSSIKATLASKNLPAAAQGKTASMSAVTPNLPPTQQQQQTPVLAYDDEDDAYYYETSPEEATPSVLLSFPPASPSRSASFPGRKTGGGGASADCSTLVVRGESTSSFAGPTMTAAVSAGGSRASSATAAPTPPSSATNSTTILSSIFSSSPGATPTSSSSGSSNSNSEKIGRWTEDEHQIFLEGLNKHGKQWKTIAGMIGTRTVVQVRTHAQKYFQKMDRKQNHLQLQNQQGQQNPSSNSSFSGGSNKAPSPSPSPPALPSLSSSGLMAVTGAAPPTASKRRSLPASLPSRKKSKLLAAPPAAESTGLAAAVATSNKSRPRISISLLTGGAKQQQQNHLVSSESSLCPSPSSDVLLALPAFSASSAGSVSLENLSTISPSGVNEFDDLDDSFFLSASTTSKYLGVVEEAALDYCPTAPVLHQPFYPSSVEDVDAAVVCKDVPLGGADAGGATPGEDPLEWLLENDSSTLQHLPESSLKACPMFPDFTSDADTGALYPQDAATSDIAYQPSSSTGGLIRRVPNVFTTAAAPGSSTSMVATAAGPAVDVTDNLPYTDPKVTVQSLFLVDGVDDSSEHDDVVGVVMDGIGGAAAGGGLLLP